MPASFDPIPRRVQPDPTEGTSGTIGGPIGGALQDIAAMMRGKTPGPTPFPAPAADPFAPRPRPTVGALPVLPSLDALPGLAGLMSMIQGAGAWAQGEVARPWQEALSQKEVPTLLSQAARAVSTNPAVPTAQAPESEGKLDWLFRQAQPAQAAPRGAQPSASQSLTARSTTRSEPPGPTEPTAPTTVSDFGLPPEAAQSGGVIPAAALSVPAETWQGVSQTQTGGTAATAPTVPQSPGAQAAGTIQDAIARAIGADAEIQRRLVAIEEAKQKLSEEQQNLRAAIAKAEMTGEFEGKETLMAGLKKRLVAVEEKMADLEAERIRGILAAANRGLDIKEKEGKRQHLRETAQVMGYSPPGIFAT